MVETKEEYNILEPNTSDNNKTIAKNTIVIYIRLITVALIGLLSTRFIVKALGAEDYGLYNVVGSIVVMINLVNTVMITTTYRFIAFEMGKKEIGNINKIFNISLSIHFLLAILVFIIGATIGLLYIDNYLNVAINKLPDARFVFWMSLTACLFSIISIPHQGLLTAMEKFSTIAIVEILRNVFILIISIILLFFCGNRLRLYALLMFGTIVIVSLLFIGVCEWKYRKYVKLALQTDKKIYKEMFKFSSWIAMGAVASVGQSQGSSMIMNYFFGTILNAAYGVAQTINYFVGHFSGSIANAATPQITKNYSGNNKQRAINLASYISKYTVFLMLVFSVPILLETEFLINLWLGENSVPEYAVILSRLMIVNLIIQGLGSGLISLVQATGKIKWFQIILSGTSLMALPLSWVLYKLGFPPQTIVYCFMGMALLNVVWRQLLLNKMINFDVMQLLKISYFKIIYVVLCLLPLFYAVFHFEDGWIRCIVVLPISVIYTLCVMWIVGSEQWEREKIKTVFVNIVKK